MTKDYIGYEALADRALRSVVREALQRVEKQGLIGNHHFYVTFKTHDPGVDIPEFLKERYPDEMTIVLQNQFWGLKTGETSFEVTLSFQKLPATLTIPYDALTAFHDPGVHFGLQFRNATASVQPGAAREIPAGGGAAAPATLPNGGKAPAAEKQAEAGEPGDKPAAESGPQVVSLDKFRKK